MDKFGKNYHLEKTLNNFWAAEPKQIHLSAGYPNATRYVLPAIPVAKLNENIHLKCDSGKKIKNYL